MTDFIYKYSAENTQTKIIKNSIGGIYHVDLKAAGYQPVIVADCVSSRKELDKELGLKRAEQEGILITSKEAILFELTRKAGGPVFKQISALIK